MLGVNIDIGRSQVVAPTHEIRAFTFNGFEKKVGWLIEKSDLPSRHATIARHKSCKKHEYMCVCVFIVLSLPPLCYSTV
jgi:hypothetical protein